MITLKLNRHVVFVSSTLLFTLATGPGCVSSGTHRDLETKHKALEAEHAELSTKAQTLEQKTSEQANWIRELEARVGEGKSTKAQLEASLAETRKALEDSARRKAEADKRIAEYSDLIRKFKSLTDSGRLSVKMVDGRMVVALSSDILFASGSAKLSNEGLASIREVAKLLATIGDRKFQVEGHTDDVPIRTAAFPSNWELAAARALTVVKEMVDSGLAPARVSAASYAEHKPARTNDSPENRAANRRIEIVIVPDLSNLPGVEELKKLSEQGQN